MRLTEQIGRSMVEILGALAIAGILSIAGVMGYRYAVDKNTANRIMNDVALAYVATSSAQQKDTGLMEYTDATSGYPTFTELITDEDFQTDIVLVKQVPETVCDKVLDMTENSNWVISAVETDTNYLYPLTECEETNAMVFSIEDVRDFTYTCEQECPVNMMCGVNDECICATGFEMDANGNCMAKICPLTQGLEAQPDRYCCEELGGAWDYDAEPQVCGCPKGYFFNGKECVIDNWCSYKFTVPEIVQAYEADCAYDFTTSEIIQAYEADCAYDFTATTTDGTITTTMVPVSGKTCSSGYCVLNWSNESCISGAGTYSTNTTTRLYGRCTPFKEHYDICKNKENAEVSMVPVSGKTCSSGYCVLNWSNENCISGAYIYSPNTTTRLYGRCAPFKEYYNFCKNKENTEISMTPIKECVEENTYCSMIWQNQQCHNLGTYANNTTTTLYGICKPFNDETENICPFK